jgi:DNA polymerase
MVKARDDEGYVTRLTGAKDVMGRLLEDIKVSETPPEDDVVELLEVLQFGRASSSIKFEKMLQQEVDGRIHNQFVFNGARHRFSSRGIQLHNLPRAFYEDELDILDLVAAQAPIEKLRAYGPVSQTLSKILRPTVIAPKGRTLIWADYSAVEARVNPWLANSRDAEAAVLEPFRLMDADKTKSIPDIYVLNAAVVFGIPAEVIWERLQNGDKEAKAMRQAGKVMVLSLGFLGSVGALKAMARGYNIRLTDEEAKVWVDGWRDRNRWARRFGDKVEAAMFSAMRHPMQYYPAGRVSYIFVPNLMGGTLVAMLPDGRPITYPKARIEQREKFGKMQDTITYIDGMARMSMWPGLAVENLTQFTAAGLLRESIVRIDAEETESEIIGHTHDEIVLETAEDGAEKVVKRLVEKMTTGFAWADGLPLAAEPAMSWYYTKNEKASAVHF